MTGLMAGDESRVTIAGRDFEVHPVAAMFPEFPPEEYVSLRADIEANGVRFPVVVCGRWLVDGRTRLRACRDLDLEPPVRELDEGTDVVEWIVSANVRRRHLSTSQRAVLAAQLADGEGVTLDDAASSLSVSRMSVARARAAREIESGKVQAALGDGTVTVGDAYKVRGVDTVRLDAAVDAVRGGEAGSLVQALDLADESPEPAAVPGGPDGAAALPPAGDSGAGPASPRDSGRGDEAGPARSSGGTSRPAVEWEATDELRDRASAACGGAAPVDGRRLGPPEQWHGHVLWCAPSGEASGAGLAAALDGQELESAIVLTRCVPGEEWAQRLLSAGRLSVVAFGAGGNGACRWLQGDGAVGPVMLWGFGVDRSLFARAFRDFGAVVPVNGR